MQYMVSNFVCLGIGYELIGRRTLENNQTGLESGIRLLDLLDLILQTRPNILGDLRAIDLSGCHGGSGAVG